MPHQCRGCVCYRLHVIMKRPNSNSFSADDRWIMSKIITLLVMIMMFLFAFTSSTSFVVTAWTPPLSPQQQPQHRLSSSSSCRTRYIKKTRYPMKTRFVTTTSTKSLSNTQLYGIFDNLFNIYDSKIPPELQDEIYKAEANTAAAQNRNQRVAIYTSLTLLGIAMAIFNGFLTEIRTTSILPEGSVDAVTTTNNNNLDILIQAGFGWVLENPLWKFLFTNKIGGAICVLIGGSSGLLAEAELDSKRINAEKIYEELERRRNEKLVSGKNKNKQSTNTKKRRRSGKEQKRLSALSEVIENNEPTSTKFESSSDHKSTTTSQLDENDEAQESESTSSSTSSTGEHNKGILGQMKELYEKADTMAASQALLLNKKLEDTGFVEKITDETGLKIIGKEQAKKRQLDKEEERNDNTTTKEGNQP